MNEKRLTRRSILRLAGLAAASLGAGAWKAQEAEGGGPAAVESGAVTCVLTPELTEGPYYIPNDRTTSRTRSSGATSPTDIPEPP